MVPPIYALSPSSEVHSGERAFSLRRHRIWMISMFFDIIVKDGFVVDGSGNPWFRANVGAKRGRISGIGRLRKGGSSHGSRIPQIGCHHIAERTPYHITKKGKTIANIEVKRTVDCSFLALFFTYPLPPTFFRRHGPCPDSSRPATNCLEQPLFCPQPFPRLLDFVGNPHRHTPSPYSFQHTPPNRTQICSRKVLSMCFAS